MRDSKAFFVLLCATAAIAWTRLAAAQDASSAVSAPRIQIVVDHRCAIQPESNPAVLGDHNDTFRDSAICHRESVLASQHIEEKISGGERERFLVRIAEQEYVMQDVTDAPAVFVVRQQIPDGWTVDSDPQPSSMDGSTAVFLINAEPGQRVRLHVGLRHTAPLAESGN